MAKVVSTPQAFKQKDMTRAIKAAAAAGARSVRFMVGKLTVEVPINCMAESSDKQTNDTDANLRNSRRGTAMAKGGLPEP
jgi:hypothetical protein